MSHIAKETDIVENTLHINSLLKSEKDLLLLRTKIFEKIRTLTAIEKPFAAFSNFISLEQVGKIRQQINMMIAGVKAAMKHRDVEMLKYRLMQLQRSATFMGISVFKTAYKDTFNYCFKAIAQLYRELSEKFLHSLKQVSDACIRKEVVDVLNGLKFVSLYSNDQKLHLLKLCELVTEESFRSLVIENFCELSCRLILSESENILCDVSSACDNIAPLHSLGRFKAGGHVQSIQRNNDELFTSNGMLQIQILVKSIGILQILEEV